MSYLLDTGVVLSLAGELPAWVDEFEGKGGFCAISVITLDELLRSLEIARSGAIRAKRMAFIERVSQKFEVLPIDEAVTRVHAVFCDGLGGKAQQFPIMQKWMIATCLARSLTLVTHEENDYQGVKGLDIHRVQY